MNSHVIDSRYLNDLFGTEALRRVFSDSAQLQSWLDFEAALARAEAAVGLVPAEAAAEITRKARAELIDLDALHEGVNFTGHPLISLVRQLTDLCDGEAGRYVHWGATTQDVTDTGLMLQAQAAHGIILRDLAVLADALARSGAPRARHADAGPHARPARHADHVRVQGRRLAGRGPAARRADGAARARVCSSASSPARRRRWPPSATTRRVRWRCSGG